MPFTWTPELKEVLDEQGAAESILSDLRNFAIAHRKNTTAGRTPPLTEHENEVLDEIIEILKTARKNCENFFQTHSFNS